MSRFSRLVSRRKNLVYAFKGPVPDVVLEDPQLRIIELDSEAVERYFPDPKDLSRKNRYLRFLELGCKGYAVVDDDAWAAAGWIVFPSTAAVPAHLPPGVRRAPWLFEAHTKEGYRRRGLHKALVNERLKFLESIQKGGKAIAMTDVNANNIASRKTQEGAGFTPAGSVTSFEFKLPKVPRRPFGWYNRLAKHPEIVEVEEA